MTIAWSATLSIADPQGGIVQIDSMPRSRMHADLATVGASYGVVLFKPSKPPVSRTLAWPSCARRAPSSGTSRSFPPRRAPGCSAPPGWAPGFGLRVPGARASRASGAASACWPSESPRIDAVQADGGLRQERLDRLVQARGRPGARALAFGAQYRQHGDALVAHRIDLPLEAVARELVADLLDQFARHRHLATSPPFADHRQQPVGGNRPVGCASASTCAGAVSALTASSRCVSHFS